MQIDMQNRKSIISKLSLFICAMIVFVACAFGWLTAQLEPFKQIELWTIDKRLKQSIPTVSKKIVLILIDEQSRNILGKGSGSLSHQHYITVIQRLKDAKVIAFAHVFSSEMNSYWANQFCGITAQSSQIVHAMRMPITTLYQAKQYEQREWLKIPSQHALPKPIGKEKRCYASIPEIELPFRDLLLATPALGHVTLITDIDQITRRTPLIIKYHDQYYPALSLAVACEYLDIPLKNLEIKPGKYIVLNRPEKQGEAIKIPIDDKGQMWINYVEDISHFTQVSFHNVWVSGELYFSDSINQNLPDFTDKIVFIGRADNDVKGLLKTPSAKEFYPIGIHASIVNSIINQQFVKEASSFWNGIFSVGIVAILTITLAFFKWRWYFFLLFFCGIFAGIFMITLVSFSKAGVLLNIMAPTIGGFLAVGMGLGWRYSEERAKNAEQNKEREQAETLAMTIRGLAHNLKSPLSQISSLTQKALGCKDLEIIHRTLSEIIEQKDSAGRTAQQILEATGEPIFVSFDLTRCLNRSLSEIFQMNPMWEEKIQLKRDYKTKPQIYADRDKLEIVFQNIFLNAYQAMEDKGDSLTVKVNSTQKAIFVEVQDTGCGIKKENLPDVTKPGFTTKKAKGGSGVGMWITKYVVEQVHKGKLSLDSEEGIGTKVLVELPILSKNV